MLPRDSGENKHILRVPRNLENVGTSMISTQTFQLPLYGATSHSHTCDTGKVRRTTYGSVHFFLALSLRSSIFSDINIFLERMKSELFYMKSQALEFH